MAMNLKKNGYLLQSTESGQIQWVTGLWFLLFLGILLCAALQMDIYRSSSQYLEDALAASNLAAAVVDVEEYGISNEIRIDDPVKAYQRYLTAVKGNLNLDDAWECPNRSIAAGPIRIVNFTVYNVGEEEVEIYHFDETGLMTFQRGNRGYVTAPDGSAVEATGIYSEISYLTKGLFGLEVEANKGKLADIVKNDE